MLIGIAQGLITALVLAPVVAVRRALTRPTIRSARPHEVVDLRHRVLRPGKPRELAIWDTDRDPETRHWVVEWAGQIVGCASVMPRTEATHPQLRWQLRGMAISDDVRGRGLGTGLLRYLQTAVAEPMWCNARETAIPFYSANGWLPQGDRFDIRRVGPHQRMYWAPPDWELAGPSLPPSR